MGRNTEQTERSPSLSLSSIGWTTLAQKKKKKLDDNEHGRTAAAQNSSLII